MKTDILIGFAEIFKGQRYKNSKFGGRNCPPIVLSVTGLNLQLEQKELYWETRDNQVAKWIIS